MGRLINAAQIGSTSQSGPGGNNGLLAALPGDSRQVLLSVVWAIEAVVLIVIGFAGKSSSLRDIGVLLFSITIIKILIFDLSFLDTIYRTIVTIIVGLIALGASFAYVKNIERIQGFLEFCEDANNDSVFDPVDNCPKAANPDQVDWDKDNLGDECDNCPNNSNKDQHDVDRDRIGDVCDEEESRLLENKTVVWGFIGLAIIVIVYLAFSMIRHPPA
jgi:hypothetical protein